MGKFTLTAREGLPLLRQAWIEKRLGAQIGENKCHYDYGNNCGCAIGVMLPPAVRAEVPQGASLQRLIDIGAVKCADEDFGMLNELQSHHDGIINHAAEGIIRAAALEAFVRSMNSAFTLHGLEPVEA